MELRKMKKNLKLRLAEEHKFIASCIFKGLTIPQIAQKLNYSTSTVSNRINLLFEKYKAKDRREFIMGVFGDIVERNKILIEQQNCAIQKLKEENEVLKKILNNIIHNKNNEKQCAIWIKNGIDFICKNTY